MIMTDQDYELLSQYLDQELPPAVARQLEQRLAAEPQLQAGLARLTTLQGQLQGAYSGIAAQPVPQQIVAMLQPAPVRIVSLPHRRVMNWGFALAASLVVAVSATLVTRWDQHSPLPGAAGVDDMLSLALENAPSRGDGWEVLADGRNVRPVLSFQSNTGTWCREYHVTGSDGSWHGVACRDDSGWATTVLAATPMADSSAEYRPAGAADSAEIADFIDRHAAGIPLDARQEAEIIARAWQ